MKLLARIACTCLVVVVGGACGSDDSAMSDPFGDSTWTLTGGSVDGAALALVADAPVTLTVVDGRAAGTSACNTYGADLTVDGSTVAVGAVIATEMACMGEGVMELEGAYLGALARVTAVSSSDGALELSGDGVELRFGA